MKLVFLIGGLIGFALVLVAGFSAERAPERVLRDAAIGCFAGAVLLRWLWSVLVQGLAQAAEAKAPAGGGPPPAEPTHAAPSPRAK